MKTIFLDLDGVLSDFMLSAAKVFGFEDFEHQEEPKVHKWFDLTSKEFWTTIDRSGFDFWAEMAKLEYADELVKLCLQETKQVYFLTSPARHHSCAAGKVHWIQTHYPRLSRNLVITPHKYLCAAPDRYLIDDTESKINKFNEFGGKGILFPQKWNKNRGFIPDRLGYVKQQLQN